MTRSARGFIPHNLLVCLGLGFVGGTALVQACQICIPIPMKSVADHLIEAEEVVMAREDPDKPFSLAVVEVLKGDPEGEKIDLFLDSVTRRRLAAEADLAVVCTRGGGGKDQEWMRVGTTEGEFGEVVREIIARAGDWELNPRARLEFFAPWLGDDEGQIRTLAHLEVGRAPYDEIKALGTVLPAAEIREFLDNFRYIEWHALYILLLAQSDDPRDHARIREAVESCARFGLSTQLAAWATAFIEIEPDQALSFIEERYLGDRAGKPEEWKALLMALSVQGTRGHVHLRDRIAGVYRVLLECQPQLAALIVGDLMNWDRYDLVRPVAAVLSAPPPELGNVELAQLRAYLVEARERLAMVTTEEVGTQAEEGGDDRVLVRLLVALIVIAPGMVIIGRLRRGNRRPSGSGPPR